MDRREELQHDGKSAIARCLAPEAALAARPAT
jgi:hypothetical protein